MENDFLKAAHEEEDRLTAELRNNPVYQRLELVRTLIRTYESGHQEIRPSAHIEQRSVTRPRQPRSQSMSAIICQATEKYLEMLGRRAESSMIANEMKRLGLEVPGQKPTSVIASYLSNSDRFDNVRGQGYGLKKWANLTKEQIYNFHVDEALKEASLNDPTAPLQWPSVPGGA